MTEDVPRFDLPNVMRTDDCIALHEFLRDNAADPVVVAGSAVEKFSGQGAQLLVAHQKVRSGTNATMAIKDASDAFVAALTTLALAEVLGVHA